jgi:hypothetical protein
MCTSQKIYEVSSAREARAKRPYWVAYLVIFWAGFLTVQGARAEDKGAVCRAYADVIYQIALRRDEGFSPFEIRAILLEDKDLPQSILELVTMVYERPWLEPNEEAQKFLKECYSVAKKRGYTL